MTEKTADVRGLLANSPCVYCDAHHGFNDCPGVATVLDGDTEWTLLFVPAGTRFPQHGEDPDRPGRHLSPPVQRDSIAFYTARHAGKPGFPVHGQAWGALPVAVLQARRGKPWSPLYPDLIISAAAMTKAADVALVLSAGQRGAEKLSNGPSFGRNEKIRQAVRAAEVGIAAGLFGANDAFAIVDDAVEIPEALSDEIATLLKQAEGTR